MAGTDCFTSGSESGGTEDMFCESLGNSFSGVLDTEGAAGLGGRGGGDSSVVFSVVLRGLGANSWLR